MTTPQPPRHRQDDGLNDDARSYVLSLRSYIERDKARDYAQMDDQLFRARMGPAVDEILTEVRALAMVDRTARINKKQVAGLLAAGGLALEAVLRGLASFRG